MGRTWLLVAAVLPFLACTPTQLDGGPDSPVRLDTQAAVGWEPGGPYNLEFTIYNATGYRMNLVAPQKEAMQIKVYRLSDGTLACKTPTPTIKEYEGWWSRPVRASSGLRLAVDVWPYCKHLDPGLYRYEAVYVANRANGVENIVWTGTLGPQGGRVAIGPGLSSDEAALASALGEAPSAVEPAGGATPPAADKPADQQAASDKPATTDKPAAADKPAGTEKPTPVVKPAVKPAAATPEMIRACVDKELGARGLNAYGDPQGTKYEAGPPVDEGGRILYVASRNAEIRTACKISGF